MRSTIYLLSILLMVLSMAPGSGCRRSGAQPAPVQPVVVVRQSCLTKTLMESRPMGLDPTTLCGLRSSVVDCLAHQIELRDAFIARLIANCGVAPR